MGESLFLFYFYPFMKKKIKKQLNRKKIALKKGGNALLSPKKKTSKKITVKTKILTKAKKNTKTKTKTATKIFAKAVLKQESKKFLKKNNRKKHHKKENYILTFGSIEPGVGKILLLIIAIVLVSSIFIIQNIIKINKEQEPAKAIAAIEIKRNFALEKEIGKMVTGYPIEKMIPFIAKQDEKVAAFMVAIAKKESAWGERVPVLNGEDCFNYWGFRLKSDRMGSGGHTCFDSPEEAVEIVGTRLSHLVNEEKIDTPKEMVIWKCGYGCDGPAAEGSQKWIKDVDYYYKQMIN